MNVPRRILYVTHRASSSPEEEWCAWLSSQGAEVFLLGHPFTYKKPNNSHFILYRGGRPIRRIELGFHLPGAPAFLFYLKDVLLNLLVPFLLAFRKVDLCISADPLNTGSLLIWRKLGFFRRLIHYTIDYAPVRFKNRSLNSFYHFLDRRACYGADLLWNLSSRMMDARFANGTRPDRCASALTVPMGADVSRIRIPDLKEIPRRLVYLGTLRENQGLELAVEVFATLKRGIPDLTWEIVGEGFLKGTLEQRLEELGVGESVVWHGFLPEHQDVERILSRGGVGLALYEPSADTYTGMTDPGKPKVYLACGLPVLTTRVPAIAEEISHAHAGEVVAYDKEQVLRTLERWFSDPGMLSRMRHSALDLAKRYDWDSIFSVTFQSSFPV